jgi:hypothetical protein
MNSEETAVADVAFVTNHSDFGFDSMATPVFKPK